MSKGPVIVGLTGTPMPARVRDLYHPLSLLFPGRWGSFISFARRYCDAHQENIENVGNVWVTDGSSNLQELHDRLAVYMLRREKREVLDELPPITRVMIPVAKAKSDEEAEIAAKFDASANAVNSLLHAVEAGKLAHACLLAKELIDQGQRPLFYVVARKHAQQLAEMLTETLRRPVVYVHGEHPRDVGDRIALLKKQDVAVATMYSVEVGVNLVNFSCAVFVGLDWVPKTLVQAEGRLHRIGQRDNVTVYYLIKLGTLDEAVRDVVISRLDTSATVLGSETQGDMSRDIMNFNPQQLLEALANRWMGKVSDNEEDEDEDEDETTGQT